ncbi:MAG: prepilin-type N-terminal cleavage/methylation domain-containing protein [Acetomicrobium flavidum]|uniref:prepilin-type N-terminal cleavage/methylation domain-containing protein n=1 Tax=Acetomicrobium flavidum TaxID=49896 RepID=UPI00169EE0EC|nr:prepilin-type N-terminal cleavage/methylation domain-containing protein [Acetomicrobium flavidum]
MKGNKSFKGMTLIEVLISLALLSVLMVVVLFTSTWLFTFVKNRLIALPNYVIGLSRAYSAVYLNAQDIQLSATYSVDKNLPSVTLYKKSGSDLVSITVNFKELIRAEALSTATSATVTLEVQTASVSIQQPADNKFLLLLYLSIPSSDGRRFDNTVVIKKLVNAAPVPESFTRNGNNVIVDLYYPALGFGVRPTGSSDLQLVTDTSTITTIIDDNGVRKTATVSLTGTTTINGRNVYQELYIQTSATTQPVFVTIPPLIGVDGTPCEDVTVKVESP